MTDAPRTPVRRVGIIGTGVIGNAWPALTRVGLAPGADLRRLRFAGDVAACVRDADFVQESAPENDALKRRILAEIDAAAAPDVIIASSSSGLLPSSIQSDCRHPGRVVIGHPFNPVYLLPLVEVLGGDKSSAAAIEAAIAFYDSSLSMRPLRVRTEV